MNREELLDDGRRESLKQARLDLDTFDKIEDTKSWQRILEIAAGQIQNRRETLCSKPDIQLTEARTSNDFEKGIIEGIRLMVAIPAIAVKQAQDMIAEDAQRNPITEELNDAT